MLKETKTKTQSMEREEVINIYMNIHFRGLSNNMVLKERRKEKGVMDGQI